MSQKPHSKQKYQIGDTVLLRLLWDEDIYEGVIIKVPWSSDLYTIKVLMPDEGIKCKLVPEDDIIVKVG